MKASEWERSDDDSEPAAEPARRSSAPPDPALRAWLTDTLRPSQNPPPSEPPSRASGSDATVADALRTGDLASLSAAAESESHDATSESALADDDHAETLAPQVIADEPPDFSDEDLAVIGLRHAPSPWGSRARVALGAAVLLAIVAGVVHLTSRGPEPPPDLAAPPPPNTKVVDLAAALAPGDGRATEESSDASKGTRAKKPSRGAPLPDGPPDVEAAKPAAPKGPSVGRLPDLPRAQLDRLIRETKSERP